MSRKAMLKALDVLEVLNGAETVDGILIYTTDEIFALRQALAQSEQEPISTNDHLCAMLRQVHDVLACTALPMKRKWVGLTDDEKTEIFMQAEFNDLTERQMYDVVEAKLKEKNGAL